MSYFRRFLDFLATPSGRKFSMISVGVAGIAGFTIKIGPHTLFLNNYMQFAHLCKEGSPRPVPEVLEKRFKKASDLAKIPESDQKLIKPFMVAGIDAFHAGSTKTPWGAIVGMPINFDPAGFDISKLMILGEPVTWSSEEGQMLKQSLRLTEEEQLFAIVREIYLTQTHQKLINALIAAGSIFGLYFSARTLNNRMNNFSRPRSLRITLYVLFTTFFLGLYFTLTDEMTQRYEAWVDQKLLELGDDWVKVGVSFYDKLLKKNIAMRKIANLQIFTAGGNQSTFIRTPNLPLTSRKRFFEERLKDMRAEGSVAS